MAGRRMFAKSVVLSDAFLDMPATARNLYFMLGMVADDDGVVSNPKSILRQCGAGEDDLNVLINKRYLLYFEESGIVIIKHWKMNNYIQKDRYNKTTYLEELKTLMIDERGAYTEIYKRTIEEVEVKENIENNECIQNVSKMDTKCIQDVSKVDTRCQQNGYTGKVSIVKDSLVKDNVCDIQPSINIYRDQEKTTDDDIGPNEFKKNDIHDRVAAALLKYIPSANSIWFEKIDKFRSRNLSDDLIITAIENTALANTRDCRYFVAICEEYIAKGFKTVREVEEAKIIYKNKKNTMSAKSDMDEYDKEFRENLKRQFSKKQEKT